MANITCFGEVLWDVFPTHKKIGGAPLNVAIRLQSLKNNVSIISSVGHDKKGVQIVDFIKEHHLNTTALQVHQSFKTGKVKVTLDKNGAASYTIMQPRAWDAIALTAEAKNCTATADAFVYGSLIARETSSKHTLYELLKLAKYKIFDVNLRAPFYNIEVLTHLMQSANFIKFNDDEIIEITKALNTETNSLEAHIKWIATNTNTKSICVTKGGEGAILYYNDVFYYNTGYKVDVVDTVGAGDSFLASLINQLLKNTAPQKAINFACAVGAIVASKEGANPIITDSEINEFLNSTTE